MSSPLDAKRKLRPAVSAIARTWLSLWTGLAAKPSVKQPVNSYRRVTVRVF
jgi:hypothetical protein